MAVEVTRMMASLGLRMVGSGTVSTETDRLPCQVSARMGSRTPPGPDERPDGRLRADPAPERARPQPADAVVGEGGSRGVHAGGPVDSASGVGRRRPEEQTGDRGLGSS